MDEVITRYLTSAAQDDTDALVSCFTVNGVVADDGRDHYGRGEIRAWRDELARRTRHKFEVLGMDEPNRCAPRSPASSGQPGQADLQLHRRRRPDQPARDQLSRR